MSLLQILPVLTYAATIAIIIRAAVSENAGTASWLPLGLLAAVFIAFSLWTVVEDGLIQFWINHTTNLAGNQVWFDLLISVALAFILLLPRARAQGMAILPWAIAVTATASIALLVMVARLLWLEQAARNRTP